MVICGVVRLSEDTVVIELNDWSPSMSLKRNTGPGLSDVEGDHTAERHDDKQ